MEFTGLDYVIFAVLGVSAVVGVVRGLVRELLALLSWVVSVWLAFQYAETVASSLGPYIESPEIRYVVALTVIFVVSLLLLSMTSIILVKLLTWAGVAGTDRTLGGLFGLARGVAVALVIIFILRLTPAAGKPWLNNSILVPYFEPIYEYLDDQDFLQPLQETLPSGVVPGAS